VKVLDSTTLKQQYVLQTGPFVSPKLVVILTPAVILGLCNKQSFIQLYYFLCQYVMCELYTNSENSCMIREKWFCRKHKEKILHKFQDSKFYIEKLFIEL
jgi:hypothetical protein